MILEQEFSRSKCIWKFHKICKFYTYTILLILYFRRTDSGRHSTSPSGKVWTYLCTTVRGRQLFTMNVITPSFGSLVTLFIWRKLYLHVRKWYVISLKFQLQVKFLFYKYLIFRDSQIVADGLCIWITFFGNEFLLNYLFTILSCSSSYGNIVAFSFELIAN